MADLNELSDAELSQMLKTFGVNVGPINEATRRTYERRLAKLQTEEPAPVSQMVNNVDQSIDEEVNASSVEDLSVSVADVATSPFHQSEDENENTNRVVVKERYKESLVKTSVIAPSQHLPETIKEAQQVISRETHYEKSVNPTVVTTPTRYRPENNKEEIQVRHPEPASKPIPVLPKIPQPLMSSGRERELSSRIESRPSLPFNRRTPVSRATPVTSYTTPSRPVLTKLSRPQERKKEYPVWLPVVIIGIAVILGYLIYANMEPAAKSNIPGVSNKIEV